MARPVLSGTCPVKPLYGLGHRAAAQFQFQLSYITSLGNLLIAYASGRQQAARRPKLAYICVF